MGRSLLSRLAVAALVVFIVLVVLLAAIVGGSGPGRKTARGGRETRAVRWPDPGACFPASAVAECLRVVRALPGFGPVGGAERATLEEAATRLSAKHGISMSADQLISMRNMEIAVAVQRSGVKAQRHGEELVTGHRRGETVLALASRYRLPPLAVLRQILLEAGHGPKQIRDMIANPASLPGALRGEASAIFEADLGSRVNADRIRAQSQAYEDGVALYLRGLGLDFETEADLRRQALAAAPEPGRGAPGPLLTPDFLFREPVRINGSLVAWLDAKNYPAADSSLVMSSLKKQVAKYTTAFGPGAFVFAGGLMCASKMSRLGALALDGSHIAAVAGPAHAHQAHRP